MLLEEDQQSHKSLGKHTALEEKVRSLNPLAFDGMVSHFDSDCTQNENIQVNMLLIDD